MLNMNKNEATLVCLKMIKEVRKINEKYFRNWIYNVNCIEWQQKKCTVICELVVTDVVCEAVDAAKNYNLLRVQHYISRIKRIKDYVYTENC